MGKKFSPELYEPRESDVAEGMLTGQLLIAMPSLAGSIFEQAVIFVCAHTAAGAMGIVVNHPIAEPSFEELLEQLDLAPGPRRRHISLLRGGPVEVARGFVLHSAEWTGEGSLVVDGLQKIARGDGPREAMLALGYAGWGPGQLDRELVENSWLNAPADIGVVFGPEHETKWRRAMGLLRVDPALLSQAAGHG